MLPDLPIDVGDGIELTLRDLSTVDEMLALTVRNLDRLRRWEGWAHADQTRDGAQEYTEWNLNAFRSGTVVPLVIRVRGEAAGSISLRIERGRRTAEIGWWIDAGYEGRSVVTRSAAALIEFARRSGRIDRVEARIGVDNVRSLRVAERLGMTRQRILPEALSVGAARHDAALYALAVVPAPAPA